MKKTTILFAILMQISFLEASDQQLEEGGGGHFFGMDTTHLATAIERGAEHLSKVRLIDMKDGAQAVEAALRPVAAAIQQARLVDLQPLANLRLVDTQPLGEGMARVADSIRQGNVELNVTNIPNVPVTHHIDISPATQATLQDTIRCCTSCRQEVTSRAPSAICLAGVVLCPDAGGKFCCCLCTGPYLQKAEDAHAFTDGAHELIKNCFACCFPERWVKLLFAKAIAQTVAPQQPAAPEAQPQPALAAPLAQRLSAIPAGPGLQPTPNRDVRSVPRSLQQVGVPAGRQDKKSNEKAD